MRARLADLERIEQQQAARIQNQEAYIQLLEELLRLRTIQRFAASSEKLAHQIDLFDEAELEVEIEALDEQLPEELQEPKPTRKTRQRGFSDTLVRERVELTLTDEQKAGADKVFFAKVKEELHYIPAQLKVLEYWQEKAVFERDGQSHVVAGERPVHPLGKCSVTTGLLAQVATAKYADGLPLYRQEHIFKRYGHEISRTSMAHWMIRGGELFTPLINLMREEQNSAAYLQADETRIQVLKEDGKTAQSQKWMWVTRGGPPDKPSVLFAYDPSRAGAVPVRLLDGFCGILQADGYSAYGRLCRENDITRIGCWDHARRKFVEAQKAAPNTAKNRAPSKADMAINHIGKLYAVERKIKPLTPAEKYKRRQALSVPLLKRLKAWLENNASKVMKGSLTRTAIDYTLNQWEYLIGYCQRGDLDISNVQAENAIRPFALGRKAWLFADTSKGAHASATWYSLIETAKANNLDPAAYLQHLLEHIATADTLEKLEALLPWNVDLPRASKNTTQYQ